MVLSNETCKIWSLTLSFFSNQDTSLDNYNLQTLLKLFVKEFEATNCSKERPGSKANETLKNGILMLKDTSKESNFHADLNIQVSLNLVFVIKSYEPEKVCLILENRGKHPLKVIES